MVTCLLSGGGLPLHRVVLRSCVRSRPNRRGQGVFLQWRHSPKRDCMKHVLTFTALILTASGSALAADNFYGAVRINSANYKAHDMRSEEHTSELQSQSNLVCRLLLEKKKKKQDTHSMTIR